MELLSSSDYPAIRALVDVSLSTAELSDDVIALDVFGGAGQRAVKQRDPLVETRTGDAEERARAAAMYFTAALLVPAVLQRQEYERNEGGGGYRVKYGTLDLQARAAQLRGEAQAQLDAYLNTDQTPSGDSQVPTMFSLACGRRGR